MSSPEQSSSTLGSKKAYDSPIPVWVINKYCASKSQAMNHSGKSFMFAQHRRDALGCSPSLMVFVTISSCLGDPIQLIMDDEHLSPLLTFCSTSTLAL